MTKREPVLFVGHGSPMNAISDNPFTECLGDLRRISPNPKAILCISAHWMTEGTWITHMEFPKTIHDFYGFPEDLFAIEYPAPGAPEIAESIKATIKDAKINLDDEMWGFDHGTWSVLRHMYPDAEIPVLQLSLDMEKPAQYHFELGKKLRKLRDQGIFIVASGNIVHNLPKMKRAAIAESYDWAIEFDQWAKDKIESKDFSALVNDYDKFPAGKLAVPTNEHYFPLLYILGASVENDNIKFEYEEMQNGSISMRTVSFGSKADYA